MKKKARVIIPILAVGIASTLIWKFSSESGSEGSPVMSKETSKMDLGPGGQGEVSPSGNALHGEDAPFASQNGAIGRESEVSSNEASLPQSEQRKLSILSEILTSKNDNDPRYDTELRNFSPEAKRVMVRKYADTQPEKRNERGTYVFLIGREIKDAADVAFLKSVLNEKPCLSLENCDRVPESGSGDEEHLGAINETTANYPQLVAIRALKHRIDEMKEAGQESAPLFSVLLQTIRESKGASNPRVVEEATRILKELKRD